LKNKLIIFNKLRILENLYLIITYNLS